MDERLLKPYDPKETEDKIYKLWEESGFFNPDICIEKGIIKSDAETFSIVLPPPNVTGNLHTGHALMLVIEDIMVRHARMKGLKTLWIPGTDHAAIATQSKVEKLLEKKGVRKNDIGREEFLKQVEEFAKNSHNTIINQAKKMGASLDWSREAFTLDEKRNLAVKTAFKKMYDDGLIYRGSRIVNWDTKGQTVISDDEIIYEEKKGKFYTFKYGPFEIGTARPETKFGDKYVVMHPDDERYKDWKHMQKITLEWINGPIEATIIKDEIIDMKFGTGVMTITPWHSHEDFALAEKYKLDKEQIIDKYGKLLPIAQEFSGMKISDAREKIVEKLKSKGLLVSIDENYVNRVATAERTNGIIEPQIMLQWFIDVNKKISSRNNKSLKELMLEPVQNEKIKILPNHFEKVYYNWIENLHDWCISRQIWYGHRIPVWYKKSINNYELGITNENSEEIYCGIEAPEGTEWKQDEDTLDTWFSSGLWTFSTLGWPGKTKDLEDYHPTSVLETGHDILFFWIARMILMSQYLLNEIPFKNVYLHGMIRTADGKKMSKSLGDKAIDPLDIIEKYGNDALRMAMIVGNTPGNDLKLNEDDIRGYKKFTNKIWNASRFVIEQTKDINLSNLAELDEEDKKSKIELDLLIKEVTKEMNEFRYSIVAEKLYHYFWHTFADIIIERSKKKILENKSPDSAKALLYIELINLLKLLHPFIPFVTEEIWSIIKNSNKDDLIIIAKWPSF
ncbi:MAG: valyl-tRNA synthetase [Candidatus Nomurabacteria bacterium GW2011_GWE1_32_28]|uniref:Valine--tRNA ligase n=1 Tax=Candidatus Nomurabacteria bacterium GW2011_GWF1_31_48 TaxID=1618767 RepID=A0A0F9YFJ6_9BACT|nr:MAG: valyl-tRNA synthetase [Candidatus Nomurabacteria bacterium GW2011_GWF2_30_133]KKP29091.1 MAG: valyl-tRNA synthetase [Candidatus Nomurabacteria bacterium GW2011_GWE2_31_40]KKP30499.1 MAG: valyl-tRNA synthetase [Candidatus Nomurabacteria bacterium GW2011_GWF1_31_48]KKP34984.1 MAG: valyl-tRNA synthetase [Candidatus Nomurabacteria bacterium GW2011_GWE1_32_28]HAS80648.1 valine--tRNA ligase [Candidatus Nomurabacteria bacterium]